MNSEPPAISDIVSSINVIPVLVIDDLSKAVPLARALVAGGLNVLEVTLRTDVALQAIKEMSKVADAVVGVGTLTSAKDVENAIEAGAQFGVSPGSTDPVIDACASEGLPLLPGIDNVSDAMRNHDRGFTYQKFFPAQQSGGVDKLRSLASPLPQINFCPTGGVSEANAADYLSLPNVVCVGGSWISPKALIETEKWNEITSLAARACSL